MILFKKSVALANYIQRLKSQSLSVGFVPTMGALHQGHASLIEKSKTICDITISSVFINPTQFNDPKDFEKYPITIAQDILLLENAGCNILFLPQTNEIYPNGTLLARHYDLGEIEFMLEGKYRPDHYQGVCQVVDRLLNVVRPHTLFMGQKDYQQCIIVKKLIDLLRLEIEVVTVGTHREETGLALSSRNLRLSEQEKQTAVGIYKVLHFVKDHITTTSFSALEKCATDDLLKAGFSKVDYVSIADALTLKPANNMSEDRALIVLIAAFMGDIRLIDNIEI